MQAPPLPALVHAAARFRLQPQAAVAPLSETHHVVRFTVTNELKGKIKQAQDLLRHQCPSGDLAVVFERALDLLIAERRKEHFGETRKSLDARPAPSTLPRAVRKSLDARPATAPYKANNRSIPRAVRKLDARPVPSPQKANTRYIPRAVRRDVVKRDAEQCTFVSPDGRRCGARGHLEFDHIIPFARGGRATADNLRLRCRSHNALLAERVFGRDFMWRAAGAERQELARPLVVASHSVRNITDEHVPDVKGDLTLCFAR
jgi:5-methylcytosine-specific restriction endonuclease McrA